MRPDDSELAQLLSRRFIPVRLTSLKGIDLNTFRFDYDLTFVALIMEPEGMKTLARWGTRDGDSATDRLSIAGLKQVMRRTLTDPVPQPPPPPLGEKGKPFTAADYPAFAARKMAKEPCYHCHYANDARFVQARKDGTFTKAMLFQYPLPENIGITLDVDRNNIIRAVRPGSPAAAAGVRSGDVIAKANDIIVHSSADLQYALNTVPEPGRVTLSLVRGGKQLKSPVTLTLPGGWRRTDISWRPSQGEVPPIIGIWEEPLTEEAKQQRGIGAGKMALRVSFLFPGEKWVKTRGDLKMGDVIVGINGKELPTMTPRQFHTHIRLNFNVGDTVTLNVLRGGERKDIAVPCLDVGLD